VQLAPLRPPRRKPSWHGNRPYWSWDGSEDNSGDDLTIVANGTFTFKTAVTGAYAVTIKTQPTSPTKAAPLRSGRAQPLITSITSKLIAVAASRLAVQFPA